MLVVLEIPTSGDEGRMKTPIPMYN